MLPSLGHEVSATGVAAMYAGLVDGMVVDTVDGDERAGIEDLGYARSRNRCGDARCPGSHAPRPGDAGVRRGDGGALSLASGVSTGGTGKGFAGDQSRLAPILDPGARAGLTLYMMGRVVAAIKKSGVEDICVVSPDRIVLYEAQGRGAKPLLQESRGLNPALEEGRRRALELGASTLLVFPADLPLLEADDVRAVLQAAEEHSVVISPDGVRSGTNALLMRPPDALPFAFGPDSFEAHLEAARQRGLEVKVCERPHLAFDLDTAGELARLKSGAARP